MPIYNPSTLVRPKTVKEAADLLKQYGSTARLVAGNTTIYELAHQGALADVERLIDTSQLGLSFVREEGGRLRVGATTTFSELITAPPLDKSEFFAIKETARTITPPQVRNAGTMGGALCSGIPFYDMPTAAMALGAKMKVLSADGEKTVEAKDFFVDYFVTALSPEEVLTEVEITGRPNTGTSFVKLGRASADFAVVNAAASVTLEASRSAIRDVSVALGAVANTPIRVGATEDALRGKEPTEQNVIKAAKEAASIDPTPSIHASSTYKKRVIPVMVRDALLSAAQRASGGRAN